jgi:tetratricopeptide (TPR) repeat protein
MLEWNARRAEAASTRDTVTAATMRGAVAFAEGKYPEAQANFRLAGQQGCPTCTLPMLARAYDLAGAPDSAIVIYERYLTTPYLDRWEPDGTFLPVVHKRLGELYDAKGQRDKALEQYRAFIGLWKDADPELQPQVTHAKERVAALTRGTDTRR